jgi:hypothetical protein
MDLSTVFKAMSSLYRTNLSNEAMIMLKLDLSEFSDEQIIKALKKCRNELKYFPSIAEIRERIDIGHLEPNEAWSICPKTDNESVCWTNEIEIAYHVAYSLILSGDLIAARMAFIESYKKQLCFARENHIIPQWKLSFGYNKDHRIAIGKEAIEKKLLPYYEVQKLLPEMEQNFEPKVLSLINGIVEQKQIGNIQ